MVRGILEYSKLIKMGLCPFPKAIELLDLVRQDISELRRNEYYLQE